MAHPSIEARRVFPGYGWWTGLDRFDVAHAFGEEGQAMAVWFDGRTDVDCRMDDVQRAVEHLGELFVGVVRLMPGLTSVELVDQQSDSVTIRTNEGLMTRANVSRLVEDDRVVLEYDERYEAGSTVTTTAHFTDEFKARDAGVVHHLVITDLEAPGFMGFFYRTFGSSKTGNGFLAATKADLETPQ